MKISGFVCYALSSCVAAALLAGCGGSQPPMSAPDAIPLAHRTSAALTDEALLYASRDTSVYFFSYPGLKQVGQLSGFEYIKYDEYFIPEGLCTDNAGDVYVAGLIYYAGQSLSGQVYEFEHGGQTPIATLSEKYGATGCAVDPETGDLAASNVRSSVSGHGSVAVFKKARGKPKYYVNAEATAFTFCTYDDTGDLLVAQGNLKGIAELPDGATSFQEVPLSNEANVRSVQWNDGTLAVSSYSGKRKTPNYIYRVTIANGVAQIVGTTTVDGLFHRPTGGQFWIDGGHMVATGRSAPRGSALRLLMWRYPAGKNPTKALNTPGGWAGVTVSEAP
jgi:hypothetical protein